MIGEKLEENGGEQGRVVKIEGVRLPLLWIDKCYKDVEAAMREVVETYATCEEIVVKAGEGEGEGGLV